CRRTARSWARPACGWSVLPLERSSMSNLEADLTEVVLGPVILQGGSDLLETEGSVNHRLQPVHLDRADHVFLVGSAADRDSAHADLRGKQGRYEHLARETRQHSDQCDVPPEAARGH